MKKQEFVSGLPTAKELEDLMFTVPSENKPLRPADQLRIWDEYMDYCFGCWIDGWG